MRKLRVLHIVSAPMDYLGGLSIFVNNLISGLDKIGVQSDVISCELPAKKSVLNRVKISKPPYREFRQKTFSMFGGYNPISNFVSFLIKNARNYDLIDVHSYVYFSTIQTALLKYLFRRPPLVLHLHGGIQTPNYPHSSLFQKLMLLVKRWVYDPTIGHFIIKTADAIISVSKSDLGQLYNAFRMKKSAPKYWIPNGVNIDKFYPGSFEQQEFITFIGRFIYLKGIDLFLKIAKKVNETDKTQKFLVIGTGDEMINLVKQAVKHLPLTHISNVSHDDIANYYQRTKVLVVPSRSEGIPTTILEAAACGIPVVGANIGGVPEVIVNDSTGFLFPVENVYDAVRYILKGLDPNFSKTVQKTGPELVKKTFTWDSISANTLKVYLRLLKKANNATRVKR